MDIMDFYGDHFDTELVRYRLKKRRSGHKRNGGSATTADLSKALAVTDNLNLEPKLISSLDAWGYVFHVNTQQIAIGAPINFSNNGPLTGIVHQPGGSNIEVTAGGIYNITFGVYTAQNNPQDWAVVINGQVRSRFNSAGQTINASTLLSLNANDGITIRNVNTLPSPATLRSGPFTTAYVLVLKVDG